MGDLEFRLYKVSSAAGDWLAVFDTDHLIYFGSYSLGKTFLTEELNSFFLKNYNFHLGSFTPMKWTKGDFWKAKHKVKLQGTELQTRVWAALQKVPRGSTLTYSELAQKVKKPLAVRAVASAVASNPVCYWIPCHRVVGKNSKTLKYHWGSDLKKELLTQEGSLN